MPNSNQATEACYTRHVTWIFYFNTIQQIHFITKHFVSNLPTSEYPEYQNIFTEI